MSSKGGYDYEKIVRSFMEQNVSANHFSDVKNLKMANYVEKLDEFMRIQTELFQEKEKYNFLTKRADEVMRTTRNVSEDINMYTGKCKLIEEKIKEGEEEMEKNVLEFSLQIKEITDILQNIESTYDIDRIKREALDVFDKKETLIQILQVKRHKYNEQTNEESSVEMPNVKGIFDKSFEENMNKEFGDLSASKKKFSDMRNTLNELNNKTEALSQENI